MLTKPQKKALSSLAVRNQNTDIVVYKPKPSKNSVPVKQKSKRPKPDTRRGRNTDPLRCYAASQLDPFCDDAMGCRVPDVFPYPTSTYHSEGTIIIKSDTNGMASVLLLPHPFVSTVDMSTTSVLSTGQTQYATSTTFYAAVPWATLDALLSNFRYVGGGYEIRNLIPPTTATGRVIVAKLPVSGSLPGPVFLANVAADAWRVANDVVQVSTIGNANTGGFPSAILTLPWAEEFTMDDIISDTIKVSHRVCSASAYDFHQSGDNLALTSTVSLVAGDTVTTSTGAIVNQQDSLSDESCLGWDAVLIRFEGCPVSTTIAEIKYIQHYEGSPSISSSSTAAPFAPSSSPISHVDPIGLLQVTQKVASSEPISLVSKIIGSAGKWLGGAAEKGVPMILNAMFSRMGLQL